MNAASFTLVRLLHTTVFLWVQYHLLKQISPEEYSVFVVVSGFFFLMPIFNLVFASSTARYVVEYYARKECEQITTVISSIVPVLLLVGLLMFLAAIVGSYHIDVVLRIPETMQFDAQVMLLLLAVSVVLNLILAPFTLGLHVLQKYVLNNVVLLVGEVIRIAILLLLLFGVSTRALWVVLATALADQLCLVVRAVISVRLVPELKFSLRYVRFSIIPELVSFGIWNSVIALSRYLRNHMALLIMNWFTTPVDVTCFSLGVSMHRQAYQLWEPVRASLGPPLIAMHASGDKSRLQRAYCMGGRYALWLTMAVVTPLLVFRQEFVRLYAGEQYEPAASVLLFILLALPIQMMQVMLPQVAQAKARLRSLGLRMLSVQICALGVMAIVVWPLRRGAVEAAAAFAAVNIGGELLLILPHACRLIGVEARDLLRNIGIPGFLPALTTAGVLSVTRSCWSPRSWTGVLAVSVLGCAPYLATVFAVSKAEDRTWLMPFAKRRIVNA
jgi:O-antigen/teichoic acid export membrane protein